jgi:hypothetical protein
MFSSPLKPPKYKRPHRRLLVEMFGRMALIWVVLLSAVQIHDAAVSVPRWFGDNMVFQKNNEYGARSFINGRAKPGENVVVTFNGKSKFPAVADKNGEWEVQFNSAGVGNGPGTVEITGEDGPSIKAKNVMGGGKLIS